MHFDQRTQAALAAAGLSREELATASEHVADVVEDTAADLEAFFDAADVVYSDMDRAHGAAEYPEHVVRYLDTYTHADELRGWLRFDGWGAYVEDGRRLSGEVVELSLGPTVHDRVRFATDRDAL